MNAEKSCAQSVTDANPVMNVNVYTTGGKKGSRALFGQEMIMFESKAINCSAYTNNTLIKGLLLE